MLKDKFVLSCIIIISAILACDRGEWMLAVEIERSAELPFLISSVVDYGDYGGDIMIEYSAGYRDSALVTVIESPEKINEVCGNVYYASDSVPRLESFFPDSGALVITTNVLWYEDKFDGYEYSFLDSTFSVKLYLQYAQNVYNPIPAAYSHMLIFGVERASNQCINSQ